VELEHVEGVQAGSAQAGLQAGPDVAAGEGLGRVQAAGRGPDPVRRRHLGRDVEVLAPVIAHDLADDALALPVAAGGVDEVDAELDRPVQRPERFVLLRADPHRPADPPCPVADL
jgi:hypothetical protein